MSSITNNNDDHPNPDLKDMHESLMQLQELNVIHYRIIDYHRIGVQYNKEYSNFVFLNRHMLQQKTIESAIAAVLEGHPLTNDEMVVAAHTTNLIIFILTKYGKERLPTAPTLAQLAVTVASVEEMVTEQILIDDEELERRRK